jgi:hypothetical protein
MGRPGMRWDRALAAQTLGGARRPQEREDHWQTTANGSKTHRYKGDLTIFCGCEYE